MYIPVIQRVAYIVLYYPIQRYKFESNSQRWCRVGCHRCRCIIRYKDTNLKAIHNPCKVLSEKTKLYYPIQRYKFESNSQQAVALSVMTTRCIIRYKDTNLKAIHNKRRVVQAPPVLYYPIQRYKFESNSQPLARCAFVMASCIIRYKDTNLKAIHNSGTVLNNWHRLYYPIQRYKFESNSQQYYN